ncbi:DUF3761 domain-containing protein [Ktedonobacter racemifer]|uniref:Uncharacterized protein n=1 Tax=Ktedonobacter racemifer DSM 44963 TaxID=485913 RepID=D6TLD8_KTERA|nr:DUF3761 domain-containing protein [Ktedonobacter racemifer]EFH86588.1 hypothetical protein Krac_7891 [Ktedonobacter racemifer DSM 44963]
MNNDLTHPFQVPSPPPPYSSITHAPMTPSHPSCFAPWAWFRKRSKKVQDNIGCFTLLGALLLCFMCTSASEDTSSDNLLAQQALPAATMQHTQTNPTRLTPTQPLAPPPTPTPIPATTGVNGNPWGYDFNPGQVVTNPNPDFCSYFKCISNFWNGAGYVVQCSDGQYSKSGDRRSTCSRNGGIAQTLYQH